MGPKFNFEISLSVLNHLGRSLYRSFATVLGEAISNAWDADATSVEIVVDKHRNSLVIRDDGDGMNASDFQNKFLKIGYSKRKKGNHNSTSGRPFIGRKGIGKLALLSCADKITVVSRVRRGDWVGGVIDNSKLDEAITDDLTPQQYPLGKWKSSKLRKHMKGRAHGTIIQFEGIKKGIKSSFPQLEKVIALYFRFSLLDPNFTIALNGRRITHRSLRELSGKTQFLWTIGDYTDPFVDELRVGFAKSPDEHKITKLKIPGAKGFIASVEKPRDLKVIGTEERVGVDLFVNGRVRERDILKHTPTAQIPESYLYGQVHFNGLDDAVDRFTTSREGIVADDPKYLEFLKRLRQEILRIVDQWDQLRLSRRDEGDPENPRISKTRRASRGLYGAVSKAYDLPKNAGSKKGRETVSQWVNELSADAEVNFESYADCFVSENLIRKFIKNRKIALSKEAIVTAKDMRAREKASKGKGNISIAIRREASDASYLAMHDLANLVDKSPDPGKEAGLSRDANEYKPIRDAMAHTALLTDVAKQRLATVRENIKGRVKTILATSKP